MNGLTKPHYLLFSESSPGTVTSSQPSGRWRFQLESLDGSATFAAMDDEPGMSGERLELLAVVRGLEALDQPSQVTLVTSSRYVSHGLRYGIPGWREAGWQWEHFGRMSPITNADLWQRIDRALAIHAVRCRAWRLDAVTTAPGHWAAARRERRAVRPPGALRFRLWRSLLGWVKGWRSTRFRVHPPLLCPQ